MNNVVQGFVAQLTELARRAALDTLESAFGGNAGRIAVLGAIPPGNHITAEIVSISAN